jgi:RNA polymerase sigma-70 factor (ECF subfamily)
MSPSACGARNADERADARRLTAFAFAPSGLGLLCTRQRRAGPTAAGVRSAPPPHAPAAQRPRPPESSGRRRRTSRQEGREAAFRELVRRYERPVFSLVFRMVRDREVAEDLAQDAFIKVLNHIDKYSPEFKFSSWLFKIANNVAIDHLRRKKLDTISMDGSPHAHSAAEVEATTSRWRRGRSRPSTSSRRASSGRRSSARFAQAPAAVPVVHHAQARRGPLVRGDRRDARPPARHVKTYIHRARHELRRALEHLKE